jgi:hypothetical protein
MLVKTSKTGIERGQVQDNIIREEIMVEHRLTGWLRPALWFVALAGLLSLAGCGGGGSPNNPYTPPPPTPPTLEVSPSPINVFSGTPATLTILSGTAPFSVFSDTPAVLPVAQSVAGNTIVLLANQVGASTTAHLTVRDASGQSLDVSVNIIPAPLLNNLAFTPTGTDCGADLCSAQTGTARVLALGPGGSPLVGRQIRFDVVYGPIAFNTSIPSNPQAQTITVVTDNAGAAEVSVQALANSTTQPAQIRATDVTSGNVQIANFNVINSTNASQSPITVVPNSANITGPDTATCSSGFRIDYNIFGGTPPYTVQSTFPQAVTLNTNTVSRSGGFFEATTNGACVNPLQFTISDSAGKQTTAQLQNVPGTAPPATAPQPAALVVAPSSVTNDACTGKTFNFVVSGGTPPYNIVPAVSGVTASPQVLNGPGAVAINGTTTGSGTTTVTVIDSGSPKQTFTATVTCS